MSLLDILREPGAVGAGLDDAETTESHARIIRRKPFLNRLYRAFYEEFAAHAGAGDAGPGVSPTGLYVELGSGGGIIKDVLPGVVTSDVIEAPGIDRVFPAEKMPFVDGGVDGIFMLNGFHHLPDPAAALAEFERVLRPGGAAVLVEPANTAWSRLVYGRLHHEPFDPDAGWESAGSGRLSGANGALPWIVFERDRERLETEYPALAVESIEYHTPVAYLASGGLSWRALAPGWSFGLVRGLERLTAPFARTLGMFATIVVRRRAAG